VNESQILAAIRKAANDEPGLVLWRLTQGGAITRAGHTYRAGLSINGASDLIGVLLLGPAVGRFVALEVKTKRGRPSAEQLMFLDLVRQMGGFGAIVRSVEDFRAAIQRAREGSSK